MDATPQWYIKIDEKSKTRISAVSFSSAIFLPTTSSQRESLYKSHPIVITPHLFFWFPWLMK